MKTIITKQKLILIAVYLKQVAAAFGLLFLMISSAIAAPSGSTGEVESFQIWKNNQIMDAQNKVVRITNSILMNKSSQLSTQKSSNSEGKVFGSPSENGDETLSEQLKQAKQDLQVAQELSFEDFLMVQLAQLGDDPKKLEKLASKLSPEEVTKTLLYLQRSTQNKSQVARPSGETVVTP